MSYYVSIKDYYGCEISMEVSAEVYQQFENERKAKERERNERRRHLDVRKLEDYNVAEKFISEPLEETYLRRDRLRQIYSILQTCTPVQRERFYLHRICGYTYAEIAEMQGCAARRVSKSVDAVMKKIKNLSE